VFLYLEFEITSFMGGACDDITPGKEVQYCDLPFS